MQTALDVYHAATRPAWDTIADFHREECPGCPFDYDGTKQLIFPPLINLSGVS